MAHIVCLQERLEGGLEQDREQKHPHHCCSPMQYVEKREPIKNTIDTIGEIGHATFP